MKSFDESWKEEVSREVKNLEAMSFQDPHSNGILDQPITLARVSHVVKAIKNNKSAWSDDIVGESICKAVRNEVKYIPLLEFKNLP